MNHLILHLRGFALKQSKDESCYEIAVKNGVGKQVFSVENIDQIGKIGLLFSNLEEKLGYYINESGVDLLSFSLREKLISITDADGNKSKEPRWYFNFSATTKDMPKLKLTYLIAKEISNDLQDELWSEISQTIIELDGEVFQNIEQIKKSV